MSAFAVTLFSLLVYYASFVRGSFVSGTAVRYTPANSSCYNSVQVDHGIDTYVAAASDDLWTNDAIDCGTKYNVTCTDTSACTSNGTFVTVLIVARSQSGYTMALATDAFDQIATYDVDSPVISILYNKVDDEINSDMAPTGGGRKWKKSIIIAALAIVMGIGVIYIGVICYRKRRKGEKLLDNTTLESGASGKSDSLNNTTLGRRSSGDIALVNSGSPPQTKESLDMGATELRSVGSVLVDRGARENRQDRGGIQNVRSVPVHMSSASIQKKAQASLQRYESRIMKPYTFAEISEMTGNFKEKLGKGGFGEVFKGKLDNKDVAVKVLNGRNGVDFDKEVDSITRTLHKNCINLLGFCHDESAMALIYPFMENGSLEKFIHAEDQSEAYSVFGWKDRFKVAVGIAKGLCYLHSDCDPQILHLDIKPHNILLDNEFEPKLSDFGLARLMGWGKSSTLTDNPQGTMGYTAPEVISYGILSAKADVYGYGMLLLEMVGGRKNAVQGSTQSQEIYADSVYNRLISGKDLNLYGVNSTHEHEIGRKMVIVGLHCIQREKSRRPEMNKVIQMLNGSLEALEEEKKPVHPFFDAPTSTARTAMSPIGEGSSTIPFPALAGEGPPTFS